MGVMIRGLLLVAVLVQGAVAFAGIAPGQVCAAGKQKAMGKYMAAVMKCYWRATLLGTPVDDACVTKATGKVTASFVRLEAPGACITTNDSAYLLDDMSWEIAWLASQVPGSQEDCTNGLDDNGNGAFDCDDVTCQSSPLCHEINCNDGIDGDNDGSTDCDDDDCSLDPHCFNCGDGTVQYLEECDGTNLHGETCVSQGWDGGTLACEPDECFFNYDHCL